MNGVLLSVFLLFSNWALAFNYPHVTIEFLQQPPTTVYVNEVLRIPVQMTYQSLAILLQWIIPEGISLQKVSGVCPSVPVAYEWMGSSVCHMNLVIPGAQLGRVFSGSLFFRTSGKSKGYHWDYLFASPGFSVQVIPHCPSMSNIPLQQATANKEFILNLKSYINYYDENMKGNTPVVSIVTPAAQDGLKYDPQQQAIVGTPTRLGMYQFTIGAKNSRCTAQSVPLTIEVNANSKDRPAFKVNPSVSVGLPNNKYSMNLLELLQPKADFMMNNQVHFRIHPNMSKPTWLHISPTDATKLEGIVPAERAGKTETITLIASSNTGGDSESLTVAIPVAFDPSKQSKITPFTLEQTAGQQLDFDITSYVANPSSEPFELFIDKVEPLAPWLRHSKNALQGIVPLNVPGQKYQITLHTSTSAGGASKPVTVFLQVAIDKEKTPYFNKSMELPVAEVGRSYSYDFQANHDVSPYDLPYQIELAPGYPTPGWIKIKNNQLVVEQVPDISDSDIVLYVTIKNIPGGSSEVSKLYVPLYNSNNVKH